MRNSLLVVHDLALLVASLSLFGISGLDNVAVFAVCYLALALWYKLHPLCAWRVAVGFLIILALSLGALHPHVPVALAPVPVVLLLSARAALIFAGRSKLSSSLVLRIAVAVGITAIAVLMGNTVPVSFSLLAAAFGLLAGVWEKGGWFEAGMVSVVYLAAAFIFRGMAFVQFFLHGVWYLTTRLILLIALIPAAVVWLVDNFKTRVLGQEQASGVGELPDLADTIRQLAGNHQVVIPSWLYYLAIVLACLLVLFMVVKVVQQMRGEGEARSLGNVLMREKIDPRTVRAPEEKESGRKKAVYSDKLPGNNRRVCQMFNHFLKRQGVDSRRVHSLDHLREELPGDSAGLLALFERARYSYREITEAQVEKAGKLIRNSGK